MEERTHVQGFEGAGEYVKNIQYQDADGQPLSMKQVREYAQASDKCRQYISWECFSAGIHHPEIVSIFFFLNWQLICQPNRWFCSMSHALTSGIISFETFAVPPSNHLLEEWERREQVLLGWSGSGGREG